MDPSDEIDGAHSEERIYDVNCIIRYPDKCYSCVLDDAVMMQLSSKTH